MVIDVEDLLYVLTYFRLASSKGPLPELEYDGIKGKERSDGRDRLR